MGDEVKTVELTTAAAAGPKTSEFWKSLAVTVAGLVVLVYGIIKSQAEIAVLGGSMAGVATGAYSLSRGIAKSAGVILLALSCWGVALSAPATIAGCAGQQARQRVEAPALALAWPGINDEAVAGVGLLPEAERADDGTHLRLFQEAMAGKDAATIAAATPHWPAVKAAANAYIDAGVAGGKLGPNVAASLRLRLTRFETDLNDLASGAAH